MKVEDLYGQVSHTGKPFICGYQISLHEGLFFFAEGEEKERDEFLNDKGVFDKENPTWESLYEDFNECYFYSEWHPKDDMDGGYDADGNYYLYEDGEFKLEK